MAEEQFKRAIEIKDRLDSLDRIKSEVFCVKGAPAYIYIDGVI